MRRTMPEIICCDRCGDELIEGDTYFEFDGVCICPVCFEWFTENRFRRTVGDVIDRLA